MIRPLQTLSGIFSSSRRAARKLETASRIVSPVRIPLPTRSKLIWYSLLGGTCITALAITLRIYGSGQFAFYLGYPGIYCMQSFLQTFLDWLPGGIGMNAIAEILAFAISNTASFAALIFLLLRIFIPDRSKALPPLLDKKNRASDEDER